MIELRYGSATLSAASPAAWSIETLRAASHHAGQPEDVLVRQAIADPIGAPPLRDFLAPGDRVVVLVSDKTRLCRTRVFLPILLEAIHDAGVPRARVSIVFATGTHPRQTADEQRDILGGAVMEAYDVRDHDARDERMLVDAGVTAAGTRVRLNANVAHADKVVATGTIVHHYFAGFGGGPKLFVPGVAAYSTAVENHRRTLTSDGRFHPACRDGNIDGNPVAMDIRDAMRFMPPAWYFCALLGGDGRIARALAGDLLAAHDRGCALVDALYTAVVPEAADVTIVSAGGAPKDINFIQAHKALHRAQYCTRDGGAILFCAECPQGLGNDDMLRWFAQTSREAFVGELLSRYSMNAHTALAMREKAERFDIRMVSALQADIIRRMGMTPHASLDEALAAIAAAHPRARRAIVIENGSLTVPVLRPDASSATGA